MRNSIFTVIKKGSLIFSIVILLFGLSKTTFAQVQTPERQVPPMEQLPQEQNQLAVDYDDEITKDELPESVVKSINENYSEYKISEAHRGSDGSYKVKLENEETNIAAYYDAGGEFLRIEQDKPEETINDDWR